MAPLPDQSIRMTAKQDYAGGSWLRSILESIRVGKSLHYPGHSVWLYLPYLFWFRVTLISSPELIRHFKETTWTLLKGKVIRDFSSLKISTVPTRIDTRPFGVNGNHAGVTGTGSEKFSINKMKAFKTLSTGTQKMQKRKLKNGSSGNLNFYKKNAISYERRLSFKTFSSW